MRYPTADQREIARQIAQLEDSYCNPRKLKEAAALREQLQAEGLTAAEVNDLVKEQAP
jgi:hypothetical protein